VLPVLPQKRRAVSAEPAQSPERRQHLDLDANARLQLMLTPYLAIAYNHSLWEKETIK
jgi:hypothetical protein